MARPKGQRATLEQRKKMQAAQLKRRGESPETHADMLDLFLLGESVADIAKAYDRGIKNVYAILAHEALLRLMTQHQADRLEEISGFDKVSVKAD